MVRSAVVDEVRSFVYFSSAGSGTRVGSTNYVVSDDLDIETQRVHAKGLYASFSSLGFFCNNLKQSNVL
jgi:hypothetical protein